MGDGLLALGGSCLSRSCPAGVLHLSVDGEHLLSPVTKRGSVLHTHMSTVDLLQITPVSVSGHVSLPQSRKDKERLKQKHKKRPESPPSVLAQPVVPTADKVPLFILRMQGVLVRG